MQRGSKTLREIRSDACNAILVTLTLLAVPAVGTSLLRGAEQGWRPVMALHVALLLLLGWTTARRKHLSLEVRATIVIAVPYIVAVAGILTFGRGNGVLMFLISSSVLAGCFFRPRVALGVVAFCLATLAVLYLGYWFDLISIPVSPSVYDMSPISWIAFGAAFLAAAAAPVIGLLALVQSLEAERERANEAVRVRSDFLANMSHELRTPMTGVIGMAEILNTTPLNERQRGMLANLVLSGRSLLTILNDVMDFAKFETGQIPIEMLPFHISEFIRNTCAPFEARAMQKGITLSTDIQTLSNEHVIGDITRIGQILTNLTDNAVKFTERGTVTVRVLQTLHGDGCTLTCTVSDTGIGIAEDQIEQIFDPYIQGDMSTSRLYGGTGLGLAISRRLVFAMDGDINVSSRLGEGTTFTFKLPLKFAPAEQSEVANVSST